MTDTTPTPADRPADQLRAAAVRARETGDPLHVAVAALLEAVAVDAIRCRCVPECPTGAALAVARQLLGTSAAEGAGAEPSADRRARYEEALWVHALKVDAAATAVMAVADAEQASLRAEVEGLDEALRGTISASEKDGARLRAELAAAAPPAPADRAAVLREAADIAESLREFTPAYGDRRAAQISENVGVLHVADHLRRLAADAAAGAQPPTSEADTVLAAALNGLGTLIATSSRDWGTYRVDAWIWAVLVGWDCEQAVHDETCTHGAMEEMAGMHGWDDTTVAKARRYRAAVRALATPPAAPAAPEETQ
ncbi:hypothetical protein AB0G48_20935 [Streptomyces rubiginosohelvolus]|uniref:hypothetical protein n=1 Tax=Streptomyces rubiginosohelvolus TaxID=67362 RepID=UPI0033F5DD71